MRTITRRTALAGLFLTGCTLTGMYSLRRFESRVEQLKGIRSALHVHSSFSNVRFSHSPPERIVEEAFRKNIGILCITDYNQDKAFEHLRKNAPSSLGNLTDIDDRVLSFEQENRTVYVLRGCEYHSNEDGHILSIGHKSGSIKNAAPRYDAREICERIRFNDGIVILPHPMGIRSGLGIHAIGGMGQAKVLELLPYVDAIEGFNARSRNFLPIIADASVFNADAKKFAQDYHTPIIATSDAHCYDEIDLAYFNMPEKFLDLQNGTAFVHGLRSAICSSTSERYRAMNHEEDIPWTDFALREFIPHYGVHASALAICGAGLLSLCSKQGRQAQEIWKKFFELKR